MTEGDQSSFILPLSHPDTIAIGGTVGGRPKKGHGAQKKEAEHGEGEA
jgi:hypothetical protein